MSDGPAVPDGRLVEALGANAGLNPPGVVTSVSARFGIFAVLAPMNARELSVRDLLRGVRDLREASAATRAFLSEHGLAHLDQRRDDLVEAAYEQGASFQDLLSMMTVHPPEGHPRDLWLSALPLMQTTAEGSFPLAGGSTTSFARGVLCGDLNAADVLTVLSSADGRLPDEVRPWVYRVLKESKAGTSALSPKSVGDILLAIGHPEDFPLAAEMVAEYGSWTVQGHYHPAALLPFTLYPHARGRRPEEFKALVAYLHTARGHGYEALRGAGPGIVRLHDTGVPAAVAAAGLADGVSPEQIVEAHRSGSPTALVGGWL